jgi:putative NADPH-quinone reductase
MKISVIVGHPYAKSFNCAIAEAVVSELLELGHEVFFHNLYEEKFDAIITGSELINDVTNDILVKQHCQEIQEAGGIIVIHPNWWGQPPAILKGWVDRVLRPGIAYEFDENDNGAGVPKGLLKAKAAIIFNTSNTPEEREVELFRDPLETIWKNCIFDFCGVKNFYRKMFRIIADSTLEQRNEWMHEVKLTINRYFPAK